MESLLIWTKKTLERLWNQEWGRLKRTGWNTPEGVIHQVPRSHIASKQADTGPSALPSSQGKDMNKGISEGGPPGKITTNSPLPAYPSSAVGSPQPTFASQAGRPFLPLQEKGPIDTDSWKSLWESQIQRSGQYLHPSVRLHPQEHASQLMLREEQENRASHLNLTAKDHETFVKSSNLKDKKQNRGREAFFIKQKQDNAGKRKIF